MIEYVVPGNIDDRILSKTVNLLHQGGIAAIPTDTSWSLVCSIKSREGIRRLKEISKDKNERLFTLFCSDISQFGDFCSLDNTRFRLIKRLTPGPYVFILKTLTGTEKALSLRRNEIGVRLPDYPIPLAIINSLGCPLYGMTAKRNMTMSSSEDTAREDFTSPLSKDNLSLDNPPVDIVDAEEEARYYTEETLFEGGWELENVRGLDLILDPGEDRSRIFSTVLDLSSGDVQVLRQGAGIWPV